MLNLFFSPIFVAGVAVFWFDVVAAAAAAAMVMVLMLVLQLLGLCLHMV